MGPAQRLLQEDSPEVLKGSEIFTLDTGALLAGTRYRGDFEERFKAVIQALKKRDLPVLFIDDASVSTGELTVNGDFELGDTSSWVYFNTPNSTFDVTADANSGAFGAELFSATSESGQGAGRIVAVAPSPDGGYEVLMVLQQ